MSDSKKSDDKSWADRMREEVRKVTGKEPVKTGESSGDDQKSTHERVQDRMRDLHKDKKRPD